MKDLKTLWLKAAPEGESLAPAESAPPTQTPSDADWAEGSGLEDIGENSLPPDPEDGEAIDADPALTDVETEGGEDEEEGLDEPDPKLLKALERRQREKDMEALLSNPEALRRHLASLEEKEQTQKNAPVGDPEYEAELKAIEEQYTQSKGQGGRLLLSSIFGETFMQDNGLEDLDATGAVAEVAQAATAERFRDLHRELAEARQLIKSVANHILSENANQAQRKAEDRVTTYITSELPDYSTNPETKKALITAFHEQVQREAEATQKLMGGDVDQIAQEMIKNKITYNSVLRSAIMAVKQGGVKRAPSPPSGKPSVAAKPRPQSTARNTVDIKSLVPEWG